MDSTCVVLPDCETARHLRRCDGFQDLADRPAGPRTIFIAQRLGQQLTDLMIADFGAVMFRAQTANFDNPLMQRVYVDLSIGIGARYA